MPVGLDHDLGDRADIGIRHAGVEKIAHGIHENHLARLPPQGFFELLRNQAKIEALLVGVSGYSSKSLGKGFGITMSASGTDFGTAPHRIPGGICPLYF